MRTETNTAPDGSKTVYLFDAFDNHIRSTDFDLSGRMIWDIHYEFDAEGPVTGWKLYDLDGKLFKQFVRKYHDHGLQEDLQFDAQGTLELRSIEVYNTNGELVTETFDHNDYLISIE